MNISQSMIRLSFLILSLLCTATLYADDAADEDDCPIVMPNFDDMPLLTREERIQLMDQALKDALSQVQDCRQTISDVQKQNSENATDASASDSSNSTNTSADSSADDTNNNADNSEAEQSDTQNQQTATPSSELSGTEASQPSTDAIDADEQINTQPPQTATPSGELSGTETPKTTQADSPNTVDSLPDDNSPAPSTAEDHKKTLSNGKSPEDIPPADNDDIIARQIRAAALAEPDPQKQAKLWNEYRRYKGISEK